MLRPSIGVREEPRVQARALPPSYALAWIKLIAAHPDPVEREVA
ncbi:MAG: hypothetical protein RQ751_03780 [Longimicrobiales bacterium]|nr:hypothetical protein [Longimicrobiales bacterium]